LVCHFSLLLTEDFFTGQQESITKSTKGSKGIEQVKKMLRVLRVLRGWGGLWRPLLAAL